MSPDPSCTRRGYRIYRLRTDAADPLAGIAFDPPKDSSTLRKALELAYPDATSHEARIRDAIIDFLISERNSESAITDNVPPLGLDLGEATTEIPGADHGQQIVLIDPCYDLDDVQAELVAAYSFQPDLDEDDKVLEQIERLSNHSTSSAWKSMTSVWNPFNRKVSKRGRKTPMTKEEKEEYRKIRKQGACSDCKKRKRKCSDDHYASRELSGTKSTPRPRLRQKTDPDPDFLPPVDETAPNDEAPPEDELPAPDLGLDFATDSAFLNFVLSKNAELGGTQPRPEQGDGQFHVDYAVEQWKPRTLSRKSSALSEKRRSFLSYSSEPGMTMAPSIDSMSLHPVDAVEPLALAPPCPEDLAGLFIGDDGGVPLSEEGLKTLGLGLGELQAAELQGSAKGARHPDIAWLSAWDQLFDVSLDEARSSLEGFSMGGDDAKS